MKDSEYLTEIKAKLELESMGYMLVVCEICKGSGFEQHESVRSSGVVRSIRQCSKCDGRGKVWKEPEPRPALPFEKCWIEGPLENKDQNIPPT